MEQFEKINIGDRTEITHTITKSDIEKFVELTGDDNKLHLDNEFTKNTELKVPVVHGMLSASFISTIIGTKLPGDGALWISQNLEFHYPVRINDTITVSAEVIKKYNKQQILELSTIIINQHKQKVISGCAKVKILVQKKKEDKLKKDLKKVVVVIGATGGIGQACCKKLEAEGYHIVIHYFKNEKLANKIRNEIDPSSEKTIVVSADITKRDDVKNLMNSIKRKFGHITALVNCATIEVPNIKFSDLEWENMQRHIDINIKGSFFLIKEVLPLMEINSYGKIIHTVTQYIDQPQPELIPYITSKSALNGFTKSLALELASRGIRINMISPGMTDTNLIKNVPEKTKLLTEAKTPLKRLASSEDVANAVIFLCSEKSDFLTGETIRINGGQVMI